VSGVEAHALLRTEVTGPSAGETLLGATASFGGGLSLLNRLEVKIDSPGAAHLQRGSVTGLVDENASWSFQAKGAPIAYSLTVSATASPGTSVSGAVGRNGEFLDQFELCPASQERDDEGQGWSTPFCVSYSANDPPVGVYQGVLQPGETIGVSASITAQRQGVHEIGANGQIGASRVGESEGSVSFSISFGPP
jgi:hypothetical protein